jgi:DNA modification methylase
MVKVFREARRVLRSDGTLWLNYGDSYATAINGRSAADTKAAGNDDRTFRDKPFSTVTDGLKPKDLCGVPWRVAFALQADGWWLRSDIIWSKPNPMPESITDRPAKAHEYVFLFTKSARYFYDAEAVKESGKDWSHSGPGIGIKNTAERYGANNGGNDGLAKLAGRYKSGEQSVNRNRRSVWEIPTAPFPGAHFATFPPKLVAICLQAGTSERGCCAKCGAPWKRHTETDYKHHEKWFGDKQDARHSRGTAGQSYDEPIGTRTIGWSPSCSCNADVVPCTVLDPFGGSGTVGAIAKMFGRQAVLIELNAKYRPMIKRRIQGLREPADMTQGEPKESSLFGEQDVVIQAQRAAAKTRNGRPGRSRS